MDKLKTVAQSGVDAVKSGVADVTQTVKSATGIGSSDQQAAVLGTAPEGPAPMLGGRRRRGKKTAKKAMRRRHTNRRH